MAGTGSPRASPPDRVISMVDPRPATGTSRTPAALEATRPSGDRPRQRGHHRSRGRSGQHRQCGDGFSVTGRSSRSGDRHRDAAAPKHGAGGSGSGDYGQVSPAPVADGDAAYGTGALLAELDRQAITAMTKVAAPTPRALHQAAVPRRPGRQAGHLPGQPSAAGHPGPPRWWGGPLRPRLPTLPAASFLHQQPDWSEDHHPPPGGRRQAARQRQRERPGGPTTAPTGPSWNASSPTCYAAGTAAAAPACGAWCGSPRDWRLLAAAVT
jgi:hypothetical protein